MRVGQVWANGGRSDLGEVREADRDFFATLLEALLVGCAAAAFSLFLDELFQLRKDVRPD